MGGGCFQLSCSCCQHANRLQLAWPFDLLIHTSTEALLKFFNKIFSLMNFVKLITASLANSKQFFFPSNVSKI
jgi:hypothetical protein